MLTADNETAFDRTSRLAMNPFMLRHLSNPFFFESPSNQWEFTDRVNEMKTLSGILSSAGRRVLTYGRRRMGKTSILEHAVRKLPGKFLLVDVSTAASVAELAKKLLAAMPLQDEGKFQKVLQFAQRYFKEVSIKAGKISLSTEFRPLNDESTMEDVLNLLNECAGADDAPWTIILDEFQEIRAIAGDKADWKLRGVIQKHRNLNYVFTGSDHRLVEWMTNPVAPFFKQLQQIEIGPIDPTHLAGWLRERAKVGGMTKFPYAEQIVAMAGPCTGDVVRLAKTVFDFAGEGQAGDVVSKAFDAIALIELNTEFNAHWRSIGSTPARSMLRAIAAGQQPTSAETLQQYGIRSASTAGTAVAWLLDKQFLVRTAEGKVAFDNPFYRRWVQFNAA